MNPLFRIWGVRKAVHLLLNAWFNARYARRLGNAVQVFGLPLLEVENWQNIRIGRGAWLISDSFFSQPGVNHPVMIRLMSPEARLTIGDDFGISGGGICVQTEVRIGNGVMMGANAFVADTDFHPLGTDSRRFNFDNIRSRPVVIEDNVFIGMNSIILKGVTIGRNAVIGAGSVVTRDVPANEIWSGNPARFVRRLGADEPRPETLAAAPPAVPAALTAAPAA
ncbi:acyltransferase [Hymenobacter jeollabukensis]|uniref:Acyltransferase n=1 Tax=Hymenobacter jeollabukensis TaxID=2025313 RepID=A0A5R8WY17_9BACT|nr:acyltransferase [Hymenobacter jeollabukensis]TLM97102.1 acyltransferase [Hymenobacter jeollabukensis]